MSESKDNAMRFIAKFLGWYQDSFSLSDVTIRLKLEDLVKEAESIHVQRIKEIDQNYKEGVISDFNDKPTKTIKRQVKRLIRHSKRP